jgi:hypothetical protein
MDGYLREDNLQNVSVQISSLNIDLEYAFLGVQNRNLNLNYWDMKYSRRKYNAITK